MLFRSSDQTSLTPCSRLLPYQIASGGTFPPKGCCGTVLPATHVTPGSALNPAWTNGWLPAQGHRSRAGCLQYPHVCTGSLRGKGMTTRRSHWHRILGLATAIGAPAAFLAACGGDTPAPAPTKPAGDAKAEPTKAPAAAPAATTAPSAEPTKAPAAGSDRKSTRLNSSHSQQSRMPSSA